MAVSTPPSKFSAWYQAARPRTLTATYAPLGLAAVIAIQALAASGHERHLIKGLYDPKPSVRLAAVRALTDIDGIEIRRHMSALLNDPDEAVQEAARQALHRAG